jgi:putative peptidoglycan lipid II flippase
LAVLSKPLVASLFYYGKFTPVDVAMTERALIAYSLSLLGLIMVKVLAPGFYARQNVKTPVKIAVFTLVITQILNVIFLTTTNLAHAGLALAVGLGACLNALLLLYHLHDSGAYQPNQGWLAFIVKLVIAVLVMAVGLYYASLWAGDWLSMAPLKRILSLAVIVALGMALYFIALILLGFRARDFIKQTK